MLNEFGTSRALYRGAFFLVAVVVVGLLLHELLWVVVQVFVACIIASALSPVVCGVMTSKRLHRFHWRPGRGLVVVVVFLVASLLTVVFGFLIARAFVRELAQLVDEAPQYMDALRSWLASVVATYPGLHDVELDTWIVLNMQVALNEASVALGGTLDFLSFVTSLLGGLLTVVLTAFMALYLTMDAAHMRDYLVVFLPHQGQQRASRVSNEMAARLGQWAGAQGLLCLIIGGGAWAGLSLIGVPYAALLGLVWALAEFVPGIGPFLSAIPSALVGFTVSPEVGVAAAVFSLVWSQVESNVITPKVMGSALELHPLVVLVLIVVGAELLGMAGAMLAIPAAASLAVVVEEIHLERLRSGRLPLEERVTA